MLVIGEGLPSVEDVVVDPVDSSTGDDMMLALVVCSIQT